MGQRFIRMNWTNRFYALGEMGTWGGGPEQQDVPRNTRASGGNNTWTLGTEFGLIGDIWTRDDPNGEQNATGGAEEVVGAFFGHFWGGIQILGQKRSSRENYLQP